MKFLPREKLKIFGVKSLDDDELLALILNSGSKKESVFQMSKRILSHYDKPEFTLESDLETFRRKFDLPELKSYQLLAFFELGRRFFGYEKKVRQIHSTEDAYNIFRGMEFLQKEYLRGVYLNARLRVIHDEIITIGTLDMNIFHPREVFRPALEYSAYALILAHNHPSGHPEPSEQDVQVTQNIRKVGNLLQIPVFDHLIIGNGTFLSMKRAGFW